LNATTINIGLHVNGRRNTKSAVVNQAFETARALRALGLKVVRARVVHSNTEPTYVALVTNGVSNNDLIYLCDRLEQDAIAAYYETGVGTLVGPKAEEWGPFNPEYFLTIDGLPLASVSKAA